MLHGSRSFQQPWKGEKSCQPFSTEREGGGLGGVWTGSWILLSAHHRWLSHYSSITPPLPCVLPRDLEQLHMSRKAAGRAGHEEGKGEQAMPWVRLQEKKQGLLDTQDLSLYHWDSQITGILAQSVVSSTAVNDLQGRKENTQIFCRPYSPSFHVYTSEHPFTSVFPSTLCIWHILSSLHPQIHKPPLADWGARDISSPQWCSWEDVCSGGCKKLQASSLYFDRLCWRILLWLEPDMVLADAVQASYAALAAPLGSDPRPPPLPDPPSLFPLSPDQRLSWVERVLPARLRGGSLMWTDGTRGAGYICSLNFSTFAIVCKWVRALGGWETMGFSSKCSFPVTCSKVNLCCVIKFDTDEENTCWCKQLVSLPTEAQILCRTSAKAFFSSVWKGPSEEACLGIPFHCFTASGCLFLRFSMDLIPVSISHYVYVIDF